MNILQMGKKIVNKGETDRKKNGVQIPNLRFGLLNFNTIGS